MLTPIIKTDGDFSLPKTSSKLSECVLTDIDCLYLKGEPGVVAGLVLLLTVVMAVSSLSLQPAI